ncbi:MAG: DUF616 domain-containing protein [Nitrospiraceae bacterium]|nr:DUF616 domain-containing protein [Nitrospiraceae bacterium]
MNKKMKSKKLGVVYTCITNKYDDLVDHSYKDPKWDYVCFTDDLSIKNNGNLSWQVRPIIFTALDPVRNQRWHKLHPHILFPEYERSLWVDGNVNVLKKDLFEDLGKAIKEFMKISSAPHRDRNCVYEELEACIALNKDDFKIMKKQIEMIKKDGFPAKQGLFETNILFRENNDKKNIELMNDWWSWVENFSRRDQLSFTYALWKHGVKCSPLTDISYRRNDGRIAFSSHNPDISQVTRLKTPFLLKNIFKEGFSELIRTIFQSGKNI